MAIESTPSRVRAINPKFRRVRRFDSIEESRRLMEKVSLATQPRTSSSLAIPANFRRRGSSRQKSLKRFGASAVQAAAVVSNRAIPASPCGTWPLLASAHPRVWRRMCSRARRRQTAGLRPVTRWGLSGPDFSATLQTRFLTDHKKLQVLRADPPWFGEARTRSARRGIIYFGKVDHG